MIPKIFRNTVLIAAGAAMVVSCNVNTKAAESYKPTSVAGIDAAIDEYVASMSDTTETVAADTSTESPDIPTEALQTEPEAVAPESTARYPQLKIA